MENIEKVISDKIDGHFVSTDIIGGVIPATVYMLVYNGLEISIVNRHRTLESVIYNEYQRKTYYEKY